MAAAIRNEINTLIDKLESTHQLYHSQVFSCTLTELWRSRLREAMTKSGQTTSKFSFLESLRKVETHSSGGGSYSKEVPIFPPLMGSMPLEWSGDNGLNGFQPTFSNAMGDSVGYDTSSASRLTPSSFTNEMRFDLA
ncbi:hypothetical protein PHISP_01511 [Aspergillus sp. HF37]|nr:hypothetical protein PHISP_01511 [Aspergillus sp. HF37]